MQIFLSVYDVSVGNNSISNIMKLIKMMYITVIEKSVFMKSVNIIYLLIGLERFRRIVLQSLPHLVSSLTLGQLFRLASADLAAF